MGNFEFRDERFDGQSGWTPFLKNDRFEQRYLLDGGLFYSETMLTVRCSKEAAVEMLRGSWTWWDHGKVWNFRRNDDESCEYDIKPMAWGVAKIHQKVFSPVPLPDKAGVRLPALLSRHFEGPASFDAYPAPQSKDKIIIRGRFHGVLSRLPIPFATAKFAAKVHLGAESGTLSFPWPKETGWVGLYRRLEGTK